MKRLLTLTTLLLGSCFALLVWAGPGTWRTHLSYHNATQCAVVGGKVYVVSNGSLYAYSPEDEFVDCYDKSNLLSDQGIRHMAVCEESNTLVLIYENANIDLIRSDGGVVNITDYVNAVALDPTVNDLRVKHGKAYISTTFGVVVLNVEREEFGDTYMFSENTYSCVELDGIIYAATNEGLYRGDTQANLLDTANWSRLSGDVYRHLETFGSTLLALKSKGAVYAVNPADGTSTPFRNGSFDFIRTDKGLFMAGNKNSIYLYTTPSNCTTLSFDGTVVHMAVDGDTYWTANGAKGLNGYRYDKEQKQIVQTVEGVIPDSPVRNYCQYLSFVDDNRLLVAGGALNYFDNVFRDGTLMIYENGTWTSFEEEGIVKRTGVHYKNMTSLVQDPLDPNHHFASSFGQGIYEFRDLKFVRQYAHKERPGYEDVVASPIESAVPASFQYTRISRLQYDSQGNLWIINADGGYKVTCPLKIMKPDGSIVNLYYKELEYLPTVTEVLFDTKGRVWVVSMRMPSSLYCIDMNGTLEDTSDDRVRVFGDQFVDQDGNAVEVIYLNDIAEDLNGDLWLLTDKGPYVLYNTDEVFNEDYHFTKIKVPRNDGTNYADYLLDGAYTTCIEIDAANRKWIGTLSNGLYLISDDGCETIHHFTAADSPLPSDGIEGLALHHATGELYIGTDKGLVSYASDATSSEESYIEDKVYAYPNPVVNNYDGLITIVGLKADSHVKIVNTVGHLVAEGTSLGGAFTWNGRTSQGQRVASGVYYVLGSDAEGKEGIVTKVLFVK